MIELAGDGIKTNLEKTKLLVQNDDTRVRVGEDCAAAFTLHGQLDAVERQVTTIKGQLVEAGATLKKSASKALQTKAYYSSQVTVVEKLLTAVKALVKRRSRECRTEAEKR